MVMCRYNTPSRSTILCPIAKRANVAFDSSDRSLMSGCRSSTPGLFLMVEETSLNYPLDSGAWCVISGGTGNTPGHRNAGMGQERKVVAA